MAGNKFDTAFEKEKITEAKIIYKGLYDTPIELTGTPQQIIKYLIDRI